jgi:broad specificity phosphatase PhoE
MPAQTIWLARHAETHAKRLRVVIGRRDAALTGVGREQAARLAAALRRRGVNALYTSPLRHAAETAEIAGERLGLAPTPDTRLAETAKGRWEGRRLEEVKANEPELYASLRHDAARFRYPDGESLAEHQSRVVAALRDITTGPLPALVVCHDGTIRCALSLADPRGLAVWRSFTVPNATPIAFDVAWLPH